MERMRRLGEVLKLLFGALLVLTAVAFAYAVFLVVQMAMQQGVTLRDWYADGTTSVSVVSALFTAVVAMAVEFILRGVSADMARGVSPFSEEHAKRIRLLGFLFLASALVTLLSSPGFISMTVGVFRFIDSPSHLFGGVFALPVDLGSLFGAVVSFSLAAIWKYGALLQRQSEELV